MKKALISTTETNIEYISGWTESNSPQPIFATYPNSCRVAQISNTEFEVYHTLFWVDCADEVVADEFYYDTNNQEIKPIVNAPYPSV